MKFTWGEIQIASIQKMFLNNTTIAVSDLPTMKTDSKYKIYFNAMPQAANEGLLRLMTNARPHFKQYKITQFPVVNKLGDLMNTYQHVDIDVEYETDNSKSYYFEVDNLATIKIYVDNVLFDTLDNLTRTPGIFTAYKGFITNPDNKSVKIVFSGTHPYNYRYVAVYEEDYEYETGETDSIPSYGPVNKYNLTALISDFYKIESIFYEDGTKIPLNTPRFIMENDYILSISNKEIGNFIINYQNYPVKLTSTTADSTEIELDAEVVAILPLYIASELYKDDSLALSTLYRNQFETALENMYPSNSNVEFIDNSGWL